MKTKLRVVFWCAALTLAADIPTAAAAPSAMSQLKTQQEQLQAAVRNLKGDAREAAVNRILDSVLDYDRLAEGSLCNLKKRELWCYWDKAKQDSPAELDEFKGLLKSLVQRAYRRNIEKTLDFDIAYNGEAPDDGEVVVKTEATKRNKSNDSTHIDYVMRQVNGQWRVRDIITENSSMVRTYRSQFRKIIQKKSFSELLERMRKKAKDS